MASVRYIILSACQNAGLYTQFGFESEAAAWLEKQGSNPCAYVYYRQGAGVVGFDNISVVFGGSNPSAALRRVRDSLERSLDFSFENQTDIGGFPALIMTARAKKRVYGFGGVSPTPPVPPEPIGNCMYFEAIEAGSTVSMLSLLQTAPNFEYSINEGRTWNGWQYRTEQGVHTFDTITLGEIGDKVYIRGDNSNGLCGQSSSNLLPSSFDLSGKIKAGGNVMSLLDKTMQLTVVPSMGFLSLFAGNNNNESLVSAPSMETITAIGDYGCQKMYSDCIALTAAAAMPSLTTIGVDGCNNMYERCTSLTSAAVMPSLTTIRTEGCRSMYLNCTALITAADMPSLTVIGTNGCRGMYQLCPALKSASNMGSLTAIDGYGCYQMYDGCASLVSAAEMPSLVNINNNGCQDMYSDCIALTAAAAMPSLNIIGFEGCRTMYYGCSALITAADMPFLTTIEANGCYQMYSDCIALTAASAMPSLVTIEENGCGSMYLNCTFNMSDDGETLNFDFLATPFTAGENTFSTDYDVANWMNNINGFTTP